MTIETVASLPSRALNLQGVGHWALECGPVYVPWMKRNGLGYLR